MNQQLLSQEYFVGMENKSKKKNLSAHELIMNQCSFN